MAFVISCGIVVYVIGLEGFVKDHFIYVTYLIVVRFVNNIIFKFHGSCDGLDEELDIKDMKEIAGCPVMRAWAKAELTLANFLKGNKLFSHYNIQLFFNYTESS